MTIKDVLIDKTKDSDIENNNNYIDVENLTKNHNEEHDFCGLMPNDTENDDYMNLSEEEISKMESQYSKNRLMLEILNAKTPTREENIELVRAAQNGDEKAREDAFIRNGRLVLSVAHKFYTKNNDEEDLLQEGFIGLNRAIRSFDTEFGTAFSTYAMWWIRQSIGRYVANNSRTIRLPVHIYEKLLSIHRAEKELDQNNESITIEKIAEKTGLSKETCTFLLAYTDDATSLDIRIGVEEDTTLSEVVPDTKHDTEAQAIETVVSEELEKLINECLSEKEKDVIYRRFGMNGYSQHTLEEVGQVYNVTRERIRQIEDKAIKKLKNPKRIRKLRGLVD